MKNNVVNKVRAANKTKKLFQQLVYHGWSMADSNIVGTTSVSSVISVMSDQYWNKTKGTLLCFISFGPEFL